MIFRQGLLGRIVGVLIICTFLTACGSKDTEIFQGKHCVAHTCKLDGSENSRKGIWVEINTDGIKEVGNEALDQVEEIGETTPDVIKLGERKYYLTVETPEGKIKYHGVRANDIEALENLLGSDYLVPNGIEGDSNPNYLMVLDRDENEIHIESAPLEWGTIRTEITIWQYNKTAPDFLRVDITCNDPDFYTLDISKELSCDVIRDKDRDHAWIFFVENNIAYYYKINASDEETIQLLLSNLQ